jgi:hypothetical protein
MTPEEYLTKGLDILARYQRSFERGDKSALLEAVYFCALYRFPLCRNGPRRLSRQRSSAQGQANSAHGMRSLATLGAAKVGARRGGCKCAAGRFGLT